MKALVRKLQFMFRYISSMLKFSWQIETAYPKSILGELLTTLCWNIMFIIFARVVTLKIKTIAGYSFEDMIIFLTLTEFTFYITSSFTGGSVERFIDIVRDGRFDAFLIKPVSILLQIFTCKIKTFHTVMAGTIPMLLYVFLIISQGGFKTSWRGILLGFITWIMGFAIHQLFYFSIAMTALWTRKARNLIKIVYLSANLGGYPIEAYSEPMRTIVILLTILPITIGVPTSYLLEKTTDFSLLGLQAVFLAVFLALFTYLWKFGLPRYESSSS